ncbi:MAG: TonB-dependent receptor domain-containing protein [Blastocatellia bacterium]
MQARTGNAFASFLLGLANQSQYTQQDPGQRINGETYSGFVQDDFKASRRLTLNLGLRYDLNTRLHETRNFHSSFDPASGRVLACAAKPDAPLDRNNFAPRFGFALDLFGDQTTVVRGGFGIFYQPIVGSGGNPLGGVPKFPFEFTSNATAIGVAPVTTLSRGPVRQQEFDPADPRLGFGTNVQIQSSNLAPYVEQWNLGVERSLGNNLLIGAAYVGSAGKKLESGRNGYINLNQVPIERVRQAAREQNTTTPNTAPLRPYPNFNEVQALLVRYGDSNYHSLQLKAERRLGSGLSFLVGYTWSKSIDNASEIFNFTGGTYPQDVYNLGAERAASTADVPHRLVASYVWDLPFGASGAAARRGLLDALFGGWQINGIAILSSGRPVDVEQASNTSRTFSNNQRPDINGNPHLGRDERTLERFFDASVFAAAAPLSFGTSPRNPIRGPGLVNFDLALIKQWAFLEKRAVEFRAEVFNVTNTPPFQLETRTTFNPSLPLAQQSFGRITSAGAGRVIQFGLKLKL